jgi:hypothetical protein
MKKTEKDKTLTSSTINAEEAEYNRIRNLFSDCDANMLALLDGLFWEAARLRVELNCLHSEVKKSGLVKVNPQNPALQKENPVSKVLPKVRANYANICFKLAKIIGKKDDDDDSGLDDYE